MDFRRIGLVASLALLGGCYEYHAVRPADAVLDTRVRVSVLPESSGELAAAQPGGPSTVTGRLVERDDAHLLLEVPIYGTGSRDGTGMLHNRVRVPLEDLVSVETRTLSKWRTGVAIGAIAAAVGTTWAVVGSGDHKGTEKPGDGNNNALITIFSVPLSLFR